MVHLVYPDNKVTNDDDNDITHYTLSVKFNIQK